MSLNASTYRFDYQARINRIVVFLNATGPNSDPSSIHARAGAAFLSEFPLHPYALRLEATRSSGERSEFTSALTGVIAAVRRLVDDAEKGDTAALFEFVRKYARPPGA